MLIPILGNIIATLNRIGQSSDTASSTGSLHAKSSDIRNNMVLANSGSIIKSMQRGTVTPTSTANIAVTISSVNTAKCAIRLEGIWGQEASSGYYAPVPPYVVSLASTTLTLGLSCSVTPTTYATFSWEVVEYV